MAEIWFGMDVPASMPVPLIRVMDEYVDAHVKAPFTVDVGGAEGGVTVPEVMLMVV